MKTQKFRVTFAESLSLTSRPFAGLAGPMWGGYTQDGETIVRYEDSASYDRLSA